jgi:hypothetical protein
VDPERSRGGRHIRTSEAWASLQGKEWMTILDEEELGLEAFEEFVGEDRKRKKLLRSKKWQQRMKSLLKPTSSEMSNDPDEAVKGGSRSETNTAISRLLVNMFNEVEVNGGKQSFVNVPSRTSWQKWMADRKVKLVINCEGIVIEDLQSRARCNYQQRQRILQALKSKAIFFQYVDPL